MRVRGSAAGWEGERVAIRTGTAMGQLVGAAVVGAAVEAGRGRATEEAWSPNGEEEEDRSAEGKCLVEGTHGAFGGSGGSSFSVNFRSDEEE